MTDTHHTSQHADSEQILASGYPLSTQQKRVVQFADNRCAEPIVVVLRQFRGHNTFNAELLETALHDWAQAHEILYARFVSPQGIKFPLILIPQDDSANANVRFSTMKFTSAAAFEGYLHAGGGAECTGIELMPLVSLELIRLPEELSTEDTVSNVGVVFKISPLCADSYSALLLVNGVMNSYLGLAAGAGASLSVSNAEEEDEEPLQYLDIAETFAEMLEEAEAGEQHQQRDRQHNIAAFKACLQYKAPITSLQLCDSTPPCDKTSQQIAQHSKRAQSYLLGLTSQTTAKLNQWCQEKDVALRSLLWGLSRTLLNRITPNEVALALSFAARDDEELLDIVGPVSRILPAELNVEPSQNAYSLAAQLDPQLDELSAGVETFDWQQVWDDDTVVNCAVLGFVDARDFQLDDIALMTDASNRHPVKLTFIVNQSCIQLSVTYRPDAFGGRFNESSAAVLAAKFAALVQAFIAQPNAPLGTLVQVSELEQQLMENQQSDAQLFSDSKTQHLANDASHQLVHHVVEHWACATPKAIAVRTESDAFSYQHINQHAHQMASALLSECQQPHLTGKRVAICTHRNEQFIVAMLAVLKTGAACVAIDPEFHPRRIQQILADCDAECVLVQEETQGLIHEQIQAQSQQSLAVLTTASLLARPQTDTAIPLEAASKENTAYLIYTSGSTGVPKGVCVSHGAIVQYVANVSERLALQGEQNDYLSLSSFATDLGHTALFGALLTGGSVRVFGAEKATDVPALGELLQQHPVDCLKIVPAHLSALIAFYDSAFDKSAFDENNANQINKEQSHCPILPTQCLVLGGDKLTPALVSRIRLLRPDLRIVNHYGPTETTVGALSFDVPFNDYQHSTSSSVPIGKGLGGNQVYILNPEQQPVGVGETGEIYLGGNTLAQGYFNQPEKTADAFVSLTLDPDSQRSVSLYRTGDLGYCHPDGNITFVSRADNQVKIRGYRIELAEIEQALCDLTGVSQAVVRLQAQQDEARLVAWLVADKSTDSPLSQTDINTHLSGYFPEYMIPSAVMFIKHVPLTQNGKIDHKALPEIDLNASRVNTFVAPQTQLQKDFAEQWCRLLSTADIGVEDSFFQLGGHSLLVTQFLSWLKREKNVVLSVKTFFEHPTIAGLADLVEAQQSASSHETTENNAAITVEKAREQWQANPTPHSNAPLSLGQERLWMIDTLEGANSDYNTPHIWCITGQLNIALLNAAFMAIVKQQHSLRTYFVVPGNEEAGFPKPDGSSAEVFSGEKPVQKLASDDELKPLEVMDFREHFSKQDGAKKANENQPDDAETNFETVFETIFDAALNDDSPLKQALMQDCAFLFPLHKPPLYLFKLYQIDSEHQVLLLNMHHIVSDGWSFGIIEAMLTQTYNRLLAEPNLENTSDLLPALDYQYVDFAIWQREMLRSNAWQSDIDYWDKQLRHVQDIRFPEMSAANTVSKAAGSHTFWLPESLQTQLNQLYQTQHISPFMVCMAAFQVMLSLYTKQDDFAVGTSIAGRTNPAFDPVVGFFINQLALPVDLSGSPTIGDYLQRVKTNAIEAYEHQDVPFSVLVSRLKDDRNTQRTPFFQCLYVFQDYMETDTQMTGLTLQPYNEFDYGAKFDLTLYMGYGAPTDASNKGKLGATFTYNTRYFDNALADKLGQYFQRVLTQFVTEPDGLISQIEIKTEQEKQQEQKQKSAKRKSRFGRVEKSF